MAFLLSTADHDQVLFKTALLGADVIATDLALPVSLARCGVLRYRVGAVRSIFCIILLMYHLLELSVCMVIVGRDFENSDIWRCLVFRGFALATISLGLLGSRCLFHGCGILLTWIVAQA